MVLAQEPGSASPGLCVQVDGETWGQMNGQGQKEGVGGGDERVPPFNAQL